jgi:cyclin-dependent kinase regulatory subunit CKS1
MQYSDRYSDDEFEYRHVILPQEIAMKIPRGKLMTEEEWRELGKQTYSKKKRKQQH